MLAKEGVDTIFFEEELGELILYVLIFESR